MPHVAVRCMGLGFDSIIGYLQDDGARVLSMVDEAYLRTLVTIANARFEENTRRTEQFRVELLRLCASNIASAMGAEQDRALWEDPDTRRERKRVEGLKKKKKKKCLVGAHDERTTPSDALDSFRGFMTDDIEDSNP